MDSMQYKERALLVWENNSEREKAMGIKKIVKTAFSCERDGLTIRGTQYRPAGGNNLPIAIVSHGFMANGQSVAHYAKRLAKWGFAAFCFDFSGGCIKGKSDGKTTDMSVLTEKEDLKAVIAYAQSLDYTQGNPSRFSSGQMDSECSSGHVQKARLVLVGCSQGGFVSALTAAELQDQVSGLILFYPALCIPDDAREGHMIFARFDPQNIPEVVPCGPMKLGKIYPQAVMEMDPFAEIAAYKGPVLLVHGTADKIVDATYARRAHEAYGERRCTLQMIEGGTHGFKKGADNAAMFGMKQFLQGKREVLTVDVRVTGRRMLERGWNNTISLPFEGTCDGPYFKGTILPGAVDVQHRNGLKVVEFTADYQLAGKDYTGADCKVHVVNRFDGKRWVPKVTTDSTALAFLNHTRCEAFLEQRKHGPVVRIYARI